MGVLLPVLETPRLRLRPFVDQDVMAVYLLLADGIAARTTAAIPYPYDRGHAEAWIASHAGQAESGSEYALAITGRQTGAVVGAIGLRPHDEIDTFGYWIGQRFWNHGYATEATRAALDWAFDALDLTEVSATHLTENPASGRVMQKLGMQQIGRLKRPFRSTGETADFARYAVTHQQWTAARSAQRGL